MPPAFWALNTAGVNKRAFPETAEGLASGGTMTSKNNHKDSIKPLAKVTNARPDQALAAPQLFVLSGEQYDAFMDVLARPAQDKPQLRRLLEHFKIEFSLNIV